MSQSPVKGKYDTTVDAESAYEMLQKRVAGTAATAEEADAGGGGGGGFLGQLGAIVGTIFGTNVRRGRLSTGQVIARRCHALGHQQGGRRRGGRSRQIGRRLARQLGRPRAGARRARRAVAAIRIRCRDIFL